MTQVAMPGRGVEIWPEDGPFGVLWLVNSAPGELEDLVKLVEAEGLFAVATAAMCKTDRSSLPLFSQLVGHDPQVRVRLEFPGLPAYEPVHTFAEVDGSATVEIIEDLRASDLLPLKTPYDRGAPVAALFRDRGRADPQWIRAAVLLAMLDSALPFRFMRLGDRVRDEAHRVFLAETMRLGGLAVTHVSPELAGPGISFTGPLATIEQLERLLAHLPACDDIDVRHSVDIGGLWPRP